MIDLVKTKIMIACDDNLMLIWQHLQELPEPHEFFNERYFGEVATVNEDIACRQFLDVDLVMRVVGVRHHHNFQLSFGDLHCKRIYQILSNIICFHFSPLTRFQRPEDCVQAYSLWSLKMH